MPRVEFKPTIPVFEQTTFCASDRATTVIGTIKNYAKICFVREKLMKLLLNCVQCPALILAVLNLYVMLPDC
jgi:hypothetical protein